MGFRDLIGQSRAARLLQRGLAAGRAAHAYLFTGPDGVGKRTAALALAQALNCQQGDAVDDGCGECRSCRKIAKGLHPDVQVIEPAGASWKIEQVRALEADAALGPYEARRKVFILNGVERMTEQAANALLKTLEEPPGGTVLVLVTTTPSALPSTIVSRCQTVTFSAIPSELLEALVVERGVDRAQARLVASFSHGSLGRALSAEAASLISERDRALEELDRGLQEGAATLIELAEKLAKDRDGLQRHLEFLSSWLRDLMVAKASRRQEWLVNQDRGEEIARRAERMTMQAIVECLRAVHTTMDGLVRNANPRLSMENLLLCLQEATSSGRERVWV